MKEKEKGGRDIGSILHRETGASTRKTGGLESKGRKDGISGINV